MKKMSYLAANDHGFASLYGLWVLSSILLCISLFMMRLVTYTQLRKSEDLIDVFILHTVHKQLKNEYANNEHDKEVIERKEEKQDTSHSAKEDDKEVENKPYYFHKTYANCTLQFRWEDTDVYVNGDCLNETMHIYLDEQCHSIVSFAYET